jgi:hypothetical protein
MPQDLAAVVISSARRARVSRSADAGSCLSRGWGICSASIGMAEAGKKSSRDSSKNTNPRTAYTNSRLANIHAVGEGSLAMNHQTTAPMTDAVIIGYLNIWGMSPICSGADRYASNPKTAPFLRPDMAFIIKDATLEVKQSRFSFRRIKKGPKQLSLSPCFNGAPGAIRTPDLWIRSPLLYPAELRAQTVAACEICGTRHIPLTGSVNANKGQAAALTPCFPNGAPGAIRTPDLWIRSPLLYPAELQAQIIFDWPVCNRPV